MKKNHFFLFVILVTAAVLFSCSKKGATSNSTITGYWTGTFTGTDGTQPFFLLLRSDGTARVYGGNADTAKADKGDGSYSVNGVTVTANFPYAYGNASLTGSVNDAFTTMYGTYKNTYAGGSSNFTFGVTKQ